MLKVLDRLFRWIRLIEYGATALVAVSLFAIMAIVTVDVVGRYVFNSPLRWSHDLILLYLMGVSFFFALSDTLRRNHHVSVDLVYNRLAKRTQLFWNALGWSLSGVLFLAVTVLAAQKTYGNWSSGEVIDGAVAWPTWISSAIGTLGFVLISMRLLLGALAFAIAFVMADDRYCAAAMELPGEMPEAP